MKISGLLILIITLATGCHDKDEATCLTGNVLFYDCCQNVSLISVTSPSGYGTEFSYNTIPYPHVIQVPGSWGIGTIYFSLEKFPAPTESPDCLCVAIDYEPYDVPRYSIRAASGTECP